MMHSQIDSNRGIDHMFRPRHVQPLPRAAMPREHAMRTAYCVLRERHRAEAANPPYEKKSGSNEPPTLSVTS